MILINDQKIKELTAVIQRSQITVLLKLHTALNHVVKVIYEIKGVLTLS